MCKRVINTEFMFKTEEKAIVSMMGALIVYVNLIIF